MKIILAIVVLLVIVVAVVIAVILLGLRNFDRQVKQETITLLDSAQPQSDDVITEADLAGLPAPVQRYLRFAGVVGKRPIRSARVVQRGGFRLAQDRDWLPFTAQETYTTDPPGFIWQARMSMFGLPILVVRDHYREGEGRILAKIGGLATMADDRADEASLMRYFNEMMWLPTAFLADNVQWEAIDDRTARATFTDQGMAATAVFYFGDDGEIVNFEADRLSSATGEIERWVTPIEAYGEFQGFRVPVSGQGTWKLDGGDFTYIDLHIIDAVYDAPAP
jgi:hypothetical protein